MDGGQAEVARLRRLQGVTLAVLVPTLALTIAGRLERPAVVAPPAPSPSPFVLISPTPTPSPSASPGPAEDKVARAGLAALESKVEKLAQAPAPSKGARVDASFVRRFVCRIKNERGAGLAAEVQRLDAAGQPSRVPLPADAAGRIPVTGDLGALAAGEKGLLVVQALVRTDNGIREKSSQPQRLALACVDRAGAEQTFELAGCFFLAASEPEDLLQKTAANTCPVVVGEGSRLELAVDVAPLRRWLTEGGLYEVHVRLGPLVLFDGAGR